MKMYKLVILFLTFFYYHHTSAQSNYLPSYIIDSDNKTVRGFIDFQEWGTNPKKVRFKTNKSVKPTVMTVETIQGFGIDDEESYVRRRVNLNIAPIKLDKLSESREPIFEKRTVFLRTLVEGKANLYLLYDKVGKKHYFIEKDDMPIEELIFTKYFTTRQGKRLVAPFEQYKGQLNTALTDCDGLFFAIKDADYTDKDLITIFEKYNTCNDIFNSVSPKNKKRIRSQFGALLGVGVSKVGFTGTTVSGLEDMNFDISPAYSVGAYLNLVGERNRGRYCLQNELMYNVISGSTHYEDIRSEDVYTISDVKFNLGYLQLNTLFRYTVPTPKLRPYINAGVGNGILITQVNQIDSEMKFYSTESNVTGKALNETKRHDFSLITGLGITTAKISSELRFEFGRRISPYIASSSNTKALLLVISYNLEGKK